MKQDCNHDIVTKYGVAECQNCGIEESQILKQNKMEQKAIEWYEKQIWSLQLKLEKKEISIGIYAVKRVELFEQAKEMEKQQMCQFAFDYQDEFFNNGKVPPIEQYYKETFKSE